LANILIADDSRTARRMITASIEDTGHTVIAQAQDGKELLSLFKEHKPDMIFTDLEMPEMDGLTASKNILEIDKDIPIILVTSITSKSETIPALKAGIRRVINKPYDDEDIKNAILKFLI
jgi:two-component system chemotaxis response regulator CheY